MKNPKKGLILINAYSRLPAALHQPKRLKQELEALGVRTEVKRNDYFPLSLNEGGALRNDLGEADFCIFLDKDKYVPRMAEKLGVRLFNRAAAIETCDDKMATHIALAQRGIPMPATMAGLLCYDPDAEVKGGALDLVEQRLGYPLIVKACYGSLGREVTRADDRAALEEIAARLKGKPHLFQRYVAESAGKDIRVIVIGGKTEAAMRRTSAGDFRSNLELGGRGEPYEADDALRALCEKTAAALGADYCGIDVLCGREGYLVCEVNSNAFFGGIERVTGINVAQRYARHVYQEVYGRG